MRTLRCVPLGSVLTRFHCSGYCGFLQLKGDDIPQKPWIASPRRLPARPGTERKQALCRWMWRKHNSFFSNKQILSKDLPGPWLAGLGRASESRVPATGDQPLTKSRRNSGLEIEFQHRLLQGLLPAYQNYQSRFYGSPIHHNLKTWNLRKGK